MGDDPVDAGVAGQALEGRGIEDAAVDQSARAAPLEVVEGGDDVEVGPVAAAAAGLLVIEKPAADVDQGVAASLGGAAGGFAVDVAGGGEAEGGGDDGAAFGVEAAGQFAAPSRMRDRCSDRSGSGLSGSSPTTASARWAQSCMAIAVSPADNWANSGTSSASWAANRPTVRSLRLATIAWTCPPDRTPSR